jgi:hypothetical protein
VDDRQARALYKYSEVYDAFKNLLQIDVNYETINLITVLFCEKVGTRAEVKVDLNKIIEAIDVHVLEHGTDGN